ncbi:protein SET-like [Drosophila serrata]|uniref:protein SET-like n=1 Tax=Drosophila serrata TaxID=7274 RepID=UPI000A1D205D|nr:protein SET-like [Drosophila serrata]KAH8364890.1 hypothetical protein KR200_000207 [Drosophila serrata]
MSDVRKTKRLTFPADEEFDEELLLEIAAVQTEVDQINKKTTEEILEVESRYNKLRQPLYDKRYQMIKKIPHYWLKCIKNHPKISLVIHEEEEDCLLYLTDLDVLEADDIKTGYRITLRFAENPYFENKELVKEYYLRSMSSNTLIEWKEGKNLLKQVLEKPDHGNKKRHPDFKSFFDWFTEPTDIVRDRVGMSLRDELWQKPAYYYYYCKDIGAVPH